MPELPDVIVYIECMRPRTLGQSLDRIRLFNPFLLRTVDPPPSAAEGRTVTGLRGLGNAYSDEILHRAGLSPLALSQRLTDAEAGRLFRAVRETLTEWLDRQRREAGDGFPEKVTAFRPEMAVHGRFGRPCPACGVA